jgi:hypothetical protein
MKRDKFEVHYYVNGASSWMHVMAYDRRDASERVVARVMKHSGRVAIVSHIEKVSEPVLFLV